MELSYYDDSSQHANGESSAAEFDGIDGLLCALGVNADTEPSELVSERELAATDEYLTDALRKSPLGGVIMEAAFYLPDDDILPKDEAA